MSKRARLHATSPSIFALISLCFWTPAAPSADWPQWRGGPERRGVTSEQLPEKLELRWILQLPAPRPAWPSNQDRLQFDRLYEPVLVGKTLFIPSMISDRVSAHDTETGKERWSFYAEAPVRLAPVAGIGKVYFAADDGYLYCLDAATGELLWKFLGGPSRRKVLGNDRLVSAWPARGGPVLADGKIYFGASIWNFMGIFIHCLDAESGELLWSNTGSGTDYLVQQHNSPAFAGVSPQGYMAVSGDHLIVAGGRTVPAVYDLHTGAFQHFDVSSRPAGTKGGGGYEVVAGDNFYLNRGRMYRLDNGAFVAPVDAMILTDYAIIGKDKEGLITYDPFWKEIEARDKKGKAIKKIVCEKTGAAPVKKKIENAFLLAGKRVYCSGEKGEIFAVDLPGFGRRARVSWSTSVAGKPLNMIAGDGKLFVSTDRGNIFCFAEKGGDVKMPEPVEVTMIPRGASWKFLDDGSDPGTAWRRPEFDDASWASGEAPLGYGDKGPKRKTKLDFGKDARNKPVTCYFRHAFELKASRHDSLKLTALVDDGAVFYLNGEEIDRLFMPEGKVDFKTLARSGTDEKTYREVDIPAELLVRGKNVLAVEVHQINVSSSDLTLDVELTGRQGGSAPDLSFPRDRLTDEAGSILRRSGARAGYCLVLGMGSGRLAEELARQSDLQVIVVEPDAGKVDAFRRRLDERGAYGVRLHAIAADPREIELPAYMADLVVSGDLAAAGVDGDDFVRRVFRVLRPYSGTLALALSAEAHVAMGRRAGELERAAIARAGGLTMLRRTAPPEGSGSWTHQYGDASNSGTSRDTVVRTPLGLLWFGGPSHEGILPRHGHGPTPQVVHGRLFIEGRDMIRAVDIYTGRLLWERKLKDVGKHYDFITHEPGANAIGSNYVSLADGIYVVLGNRCVRLDPANGETISEFQLDTPAGGKEPGEFGYLGISGDILVAGSEPVTFDSPEFSSASLAGLKGDKLKETVKAMAKLIDFELVPYPPKTEKKDEKKDEKKKDPYDERSEDAHREYLAANLNKLLDTDGMVAKIPVALFYKKGGDGPAGELAKYLSEVKGRRPSDRQAQILKRKILAKCYGVSEYKAAETGKAGTLRKGSEKLVALDRDTGKILWERAAVYQFRHNAIALGGGSVFVIDRMSKERADHFKRRGEPYDENARVAAFDLRTGEVIWEFSERVFGTFLSYSVEHDVLLQAGAQGRDRARDEIGQGMVALRGSTGEVLWENDQKYAGPCLLLGRRVITQGFDNAPGFALDLLTGEIETRPHPLSGKDVAWKYKRNHGCSTVIGSPNLLTFRSAAAGFYDLLGDSGTGNLGGFRAGCTSNLIPAGGILSAPDYTRTCTCSYQNQSSLAFIHEPGAEAWTFSALPLDGNPVRNAGLNLGAPGDRRAPDGTLWVDYPSVGGSSPDLPVVSFPDAGSDGKGAGTTEAKEGEFDVVRVHSSLVEPGDLSWVAASAIEGGGELVLTLAFPDRIEVPNEVEGGEPLRASNASISPSVPFRSIAQGGDINRSSLKKGMRSGKDDKLEAAIRGYRELASSSITVEFWARFDSDVDYVDARVSGEKKEQGFVIDNKKLRLRYFVANGDGSDNEKAVTIEAKKAAADRSWVHVAFTYDAASGVGKLYQDGVEVGKHDGPDNRSLWWDGSEPELRVALAANSKTGLDELRICGRALEPGQFLNAEGAQVPRDSVLGYWRMETGGKPGGETGRSVFDVSLVFAELEKKAAGKRLFDVQLQGDTVLESFDICREAGACRRALVKTFRGIAVDDHLVIRLVPRSEAPPLLNGIKIHALRAGRL